MNKAVVRMLLLPVVIFTMGCPEKLSATHPTQATISGILPYKNQTLYLFRNSLNLRELKEVPIDSVSIDSLGYFSMKTQCSADSRYILLAGEKNIYLTIFSKPNDSLVIRQAHEDSLPEVVFDKGGATKFFAYFNKKYPMPPEYFIKIQEGKLLECLAVIDKLKQERSVFLMMNTYLLNAYPGLKKDMDDIIKYQANSDKMNTLSYLYYDDNDSVVVSDTHCTDFIDKLQFETGDTELTIPYRGYIGSFLEFPFKLWRLELMKTKEFTREQRLSLRFEFCKSHLTGCSRDYGMFYCIATLFNFFTDSTALKVVEKQLKDFREFAVDKRYLELATKIYNAKLAISTGRPAPNFTLPDLTSKNISLSDFIGKTIYMEFTGTWCGPCRKEVPFIKELQKKCKDNPNIQFLTVWLESINVKEWAKYVDESGLGGVHVYSASQFAGDVPKLYQVSGVPAFMIIDKNGKVAFSSAKRPSEEGVYEEIIKTSLGQ